MATKIAGPGAMTWLRGGPVSLDAANIQAAIDGSLLRLGVDCLDLVYVHWPDRCESKRCCVVHELFGQTNLCGRHMVVDIGDCTMLDKLDTHKICCTLDTHWMHTGCTLDAH